MPKGTCSVGGCDRHVSRRTFCQMHYKNLLKAGQLPPRQPRPRLTCSIGECDRPAYSRAWCRMHYERWRQHGDPNVFLGHSTPIGECSVDGCAAPAEHRSWCDLHYQRWKRHGDPTRVVPFAERVSPTVRAAKEAELASGVRACTSCKTVLPLSEFRTSKRNANGRERQCVTCRDAYQRKNYQSRKRANEEGLKAANRRNYLLRKYGMSLEEFNQRATAQGGRCAVCRRPVNQLHVDHDHATGAVRDLLCNGCNCALGHVNDNPETLLQLVAYLEKHRSSADAC